MNMKLKKVLDEIQKTEERITEWQEHLRELNIRKKQLEDAEIIKSIRSMKLNSRELLVVLVICPLSSRQVKYLKVSDKNTYISFWSVGIFMHTISLYIF